MRVAFATARAVAFMAVLAHAACGGREAPTPDQPQPAVPNLAGLDVMMLPAQPGPGGVPAGFDAALAAVLEADARTVNWILPARLDRALARAPWLEIRPQALSVSTLRNPEEHHVRDPLYGDLRRLGALVGARYAVVVYQAAYAMPAPTDTTATQGRIEAAAAIIDTVGGRILWRGLVAGERGPPDDEVVLGTAVQALAAMIAPAS